jgi:RND family efflux transporter MFP subunit
VALLLLGGLFAAGYLPRKQAAATRALAAVPPPEQAVFVRLIKPKLAKSERALTLPASIESAETTKVHARASGYLRRRLVDLGDHVKSGELLAEIDTPELDLEIEQAEAALLQSQAAISLAGATLRYSSSSLARIKLLDGRKLTSQQELEQLEAQYQVDVAKVQVAEAGRAAALANLRRLQKLRSFARVVAPFAGTVTARKVERGALVSAGSGNALFEITTLDPLRVSLDIPQSLVQGVRGGGKAQVSVSEYPGEIFEAKVAHISGVLEPGTRTMRVELQVDNTRNRLLPGMYANAELSLPQAHPVVLIPATALIARNEGLRVVTLDAGSRARLVPVIVERDNGAELEIALGVSPDRAIVANPTPDIEDGTLLRTR